MTYAKGYKNNSLVPLVAGMYNTPNDYVPSVSILHGAKLPVWYADLSCGNRYVSDMRWNSSPRYLDEF